jgi:xylulokinase
MHFHQQLLQQAGADKHEIACVVFSGQMMGCVPVDRQARPLRSAIIWADQRAVVQERYLAERIPLDEMYQISGTASARRIRWKNVVAER